jgi:hypothetical protein
MDTMLSYVNTLAQIAMACGIVFAWWQLKQTREQAVTSFEDALGREYRDLARCLPIRALLGEPVGIGESLSEFYRYIDLTNEQILLRMQGRIRTSTWEDWKSGIRSNMERPAFRAAWEEISDRSPGCFTELRRLINVDFAEDPASWRP